MDYQKPRRGIFYFLTTAPGEVALHMRNFRENQRLKIEMYSTFEFDLDVASSVREAIREIEVEATKQGLPELVRICRLPTDTITVGTGRQIIAECIGLLPADHKPPQEATGGALSRADAASYLSISTRKLDALIARGVLTKLKIGRKTLVALGELDKYLSDLSQN